jgi:hypothetical protein
MDSLDLTHLPAMLRITYKVLAMRILVFMALVMAFGLFCWAIYVGTVLALVTSGTFGLIVFLPVLWRCARKEDPDGNSD